MMLRPSRSCFAKHALATGLKLPTTSFPPRPPLPSPYLKAASDNLYKWQSLQKDRHEFVLHDGPPYANGPLHLGHAVNKILKDFILRTEIQRGKKVEYRPGWDCHGLPIELKALKHQKDGLKAPDAVSIRKQARALAEENVSAQGEGFRQWAILGNWSHLYRTMDVDYEQRQMEIWRVMVEKGLIYRARRPVYWSTSSGSALAEAELEYDEAHISKTALIRYAICGASDILGDDVGAVIWTTTPWTLPANRAIAVNRNMEYCLVQISGREKCLIGKARLEYFQEQMVSESIQVILDGISGADLLGMQYVNPFRPNDPQPLIHADFVTSSMGSGLVHMAPGHGFDDYLVGKNHNLEIHAPVDDKGMFTEAAFPENPQILLGKSVHSDGPIAVLDYLKDQANQDTPSRIVLGTSDIQHKYPVDWRTKQPVIIRATHQWFANAGSLKPHAIRALSGVNFIPEAGKSRLEAFVNSRSEWCVSRQRSWGLPIPALYRIDTPQREAVMDSNSIRHIMAVMRERGSDAWWSDAENDTAWVPAGLEGSYVRGKDTMDVWFDSGTSWTMLRSREVVSPADVYLEGSDQHRGWFQSSLLTFIAATTTQTNANIAPVAPFKKLITHGFTLDADGRKMSKSVGNVIAPEAVMDGSLLAPIKPTKNRGKKKAQSTTTTVPTAPKYDALGVDALRFWVASMDYTKDMSIGSETLATSQGALIKLRITIKWLLGNLEDYTSPIEGVTSRNDHNIMDTAILHKLASVSANVYDAYTQYDFSRGLATLISFTNQELSSFYFEALKDRLYAGNMDERIPAQGVLLIIYKELLSMLGPIAPLLVEEAWAHTPARTRLLITSSDSLSAPPDPEFARQDQDAHELVSPLYHIWSPYRPPRDDSAPATKVASEPSDTFSNTKSTSDQVPQIGSPTQSSQSADTAKLGTNREAVQAAVNLDMLVKMKSAVNQIQESMRNQKLITSGLETAVSLHLVANDHEKSAAKLLLAENLSRELMLAPVLGVSSVAIVTSPTKLHLADPFTLKVDLKDLVLGSTQQQVVSQVLLAVRTMTPAEKKCVRCWRWLELTKKSGESVCPRCEEVLDHQPH